MICPKCSAETRVISSRPHKDDARVIQRRRACEGCGHRFNTQEGTVNIVGTRAAKRARAGRYRDRLTSEERAEWKTEWRLRRAAAAEAADVGRSPSDILREWNVPPSPASQPVPQR